MACREEKTKGRIRMIGAYATDNQHYNVVVLLSGR